MNEIVPFHQTASGLVKICPLSGVMQISVGCARGHSSTKLDFKRGKGNIYFLLTPEEAKYIASLLIKSAKKAEASKSGDMP